MVALTKVPNGEFSLIQPMSSNDAELCKYNYSYAFTVQTVNAVANSGNITGDKQLTNVKIFYLHDWREMPYGKATLSKNL